MIRTTIFALATITASLIPGYSSAVILDVPNEYATIQGAIDAASIGDTVFINRNAISAYFEQLEINKSICLLGAGSTGLFTTLIAGPLSGDVIHVTANSCVIKKIKIYGSGSQETADGAWDAGIKIDNADSCIIDSCVLMGNSAAGVAIGSSNNCIIRDNIFINNDAGLYFFTAPETQPLADDNQNNQIIDNEFIYNHQAGILLAGGNAFHANSTIDNNYFVYNMTGLSMRMAQNCITENNCFNLCIQYAVYEFEAYGEGGNNQFIDNSFLNNYNGNIHAFCFLAEGQPADMWYENYWSEYLGEDNNGDGFGDTPYLLDGGSCEDAWPRMVAEDFDLDDVIDSEDNCPGTFNDNQRDYDNDGIGNACEFVCGDADFSGSFNILDIVYIINYLYKDGPPPVIDGIADADGDGITNLLDITHFIDYLYKDGPDTNCPLY